ncbi:hypothetical protein [Micromonospora sp. SH-82]|uniref:hypothetical protein n=1 Tax=Micromonospora sp. SH-82 TaxID=3132938 RepID=UPI003EBACD98
MSHEPLTSLPIDPSGQTELPPLTSTDDEPAEDLDILRHSVAGWAYGKGSEPPGSAVQTPRPARRRS